MPVYTNENILYVHIKVGRKCIKVFTAVVRLLMRL